ncbi:MAG: HU family DNA-binding protein [Zavarzinella sp.]
MAKSVKNAKPAAKPAAKSAKPAKKALTKSELLDAIAAATGKTRKEAGEFFNALSTIMVQQLSKKGPRALILPGLFKVSAIEKPATKGGQQKPNPFKPGEMMITKAKPATVKLKARALKAFMEAIS